MSRVSRVPYHQNVYDLLGIEPGECPEARRMIEEHEAKHGPLPASVREWYLVPNVVPLQDTEGWRPDWDRGTIWFDTSHGQSPVSLEGVLQGHSRAIDYFEVYPYLAVLCDGGVGGAGTWLIKLSDADDPAVLYDPEGTEYTDDWQAWADTFSEFVARSICEPRWSLWDPDNPRAESVLHTHLNGLWLRTPDEPFQPPVIDFLTEQFGEPERTPRPGNVTTYTFRPNGGTIRVTADGPTLTGGLSAWWIHAVSPERLAAFAELLTPWGTLRDTLRADTDPAREVLKRVRGE